MSAETLTTEQILADMPSVEQCEAYERAAEQCYDLRAVVAESTFPHIADRIERLVSHGRYVTLISQLGDSPLEIHPGLLVRGVNRYDDGITVDLTHVRSFGVSTCGWKTSRDLRAEMRRNDQYRPPFNRPPRHMSVKIDGGQGDSIGRPDKIETTWVNDYGVTIRTWVVFTPLTRKDEQE